jgi:hypothetical protein
VINAFVIKQRGRAGNLVRQAEVAKPVETPDGAGGTAPAMPSTTASPTLQ